MTPKQEILSLINSLPESVTIDETIYHLEVKKKLLEGEEDIRAGRVIEHAEVEKRMEKWRIKR
jgi:predicted transcriptional regulator